MAVNHVIYDGETLVDLRSDTVTPETLAEGVTAHDASGAAIVGTLIAGGGDGITLPDGYAMEMGIFVPESNLSSTQTIDLKNTFRWADSGKKSACYLSLFAVDLLSGYNAAGSGYHVKFGTGERNHQMVQTSSGCSTSSTIFINPKTTTTFNQITITGTSTYVLKQGISYLWMVLGELAT